MKIKISFCMIIGIILLISLTNVSSALVYIVSGEIENNNVKLDPLFFLGPSSQYSEDNITSNASYAVFKNSENVELKTFNFAIKDNGFLFSVDIPRSTKTILFYNQGNLVHTLTRTSSLPVINSFNVQNNNDFVNLSWQASDVDNNASDLSYTLYYSLDNNDWNLILMDYKNTTVDLFADMFYGNTTYFSLEVNDGFNLAESTLGPYVFTYKVPECSAADFNRDGNVDVGDLGILARNWGGTNKTRELGDATGDGLVDVGDLGFLANNWGKKTGFCY